MTWKHTVYHINNSDSDHKLVKQQSMQNMKLTSICPSKNIDEKENKDEHSKSLALS